MIAIDTLREVELPEATAMLGRAFAADPLMHALFDHGTAPFADCVAGLMDLSFRVRAARGWPVLAARAANGGLSGVAYLSPPSGPALAGAGSVAEPPAVGLAHQRFEQLIGAAACERYRAYEDAWRFGAPEGPHHYLGVLGVDPDLQGQGVGVALLDAVTAIVEADPNSEGVWLDTENPPNVGWYQRRGFVIGAARPFGSITLWGMWRPRGAP